ncbi:MAG: hypothetical protein Q4G40_06310, partial [Brachybacterium sp.]|nr:hypothetical protein [Brachybacterium sp.]
ARRPTIYKVGSEADRADFLDDFLEHSLPWLQRYESFDAIWRALLHAELPGAMLPYSPIRPKMGAWQALRVAFYDRLDPTLTEEAIAYCWGRGFIFNESMFDDDMEEIANRLPLRQDKSD